MKKIVLIVAAMVAGLSLSAQQKGDMYVSGILNLGLSSNTSVVSGKANNYMASRTTANNLFNFGIAPKFGYFVADNLELNVALEYNMGLDGTASKTNINGTTNKNNPVAFTTHNFMVTPGIAYHLPIIAGKLYYSPAFRLGLGFTADSEKNGNVTVNGDPRFAFGMFLDYLAFEYKLNTQMALTMSVGGLGYALDTHSETSTTTVGGVNSETKISTINHIVDFGLDKVSLGFKYYF